MEASIWWVPRMDPHLGVLVYFRDQLARINQCASWWDVPGSPHLWRSNIGNSPSKGLDSKNISVLGAKTGNSSPAFAFKRRKELFHVHSAFKKRVRILPKVNCRPNPRDKVRNHRWQSRDPGFLIHRSGDNKQQNAGHEDLGFLPYLGVHFWECWRGCGTKLGVASDCTSRGQN